MTPDEALLRNRTAWQRLAEAGHRFARPARAEDFVNPLASVDGPGWLGGNIRGWKVLCLAAGGGRQGPIYAAAGAAVTVVDFSSAMLELDREVAQEMGFNIRTVETSMEDLSMFQPAEFDLVIHPVSTCYIADVTQVYREVARVLRGGGLYISQHKQPTSLQATLEPTTGGRYMLGAAYYNPEPLPPSPHPNLVREPGTWEYIHRWEQLVGGLCRAGFAIEDLTEPLHAQPQAEPGTFGHRSQFVAPYVRIKARRLNPEKPATLVLGSF
jgi:ubiquinone/menaquinone biosynthesis C-methylase UbiE